MMFRFTVPFEEPHATVESLLLLAWPEGGDDAAKQLISTHKVHVDGRLETKLNRRLTPGALVEVEVDPEAAEPNIDYPEAMELGRGRGWVIVEKTLGLVGTLDRNDPLNAVMFLADLLGLDRDRVAPVWSMPQESGGPWPLATSSEEALRLNLAVASGEVMTTWTVITPRPRMPRGTLSAKGVKVNYASIRLEGGLAELQLNPEFRLQEELDPVQFLRELLADNAMPIVGDRVYGGLMVPGGLRLHLSAIYGLDFGHSWNPPNWWPGNVIAVPEVAEQPSAPTGRSKGMPTLVVSRKTLEVMKEGHPWALDDKETGQRQGLKQGTIVQLVSPQGQPGPYALVEHGKVAARLFTRDAGVAKVFNEEVRARTNRAFGNRASLLQDTVNTDIFRLIHADADGLPGLEIERMGTIHRAVITGGAALRLKTVVYENILEFDPDAIILEAAHLQDVRSEGALPQAKLVHGELLHAKEGERIIVREHGLHYWVQPWSGIDVGFFPDQRLNRTKMLELAKPGQRWLNLFCHTGAFSVVLAAQGASVVSVDLSKKYLDWLSENLDLNDIDADLNENVAQDARTYLQANTGGFDGIIVDPPTAAQGSEGFWSVRKDYLKLLSQCFEHLNDGGVMLVCRNDKQAKDSLTKLIQEAAGSRKIERIEEAPPAPDFPGLANFPEGDAFEGFWVYTR